MKNYAKQLDSLIKRLNKCELVKKHPEVSNLVKIENRVFYSNGYLAFDLDNEDGKYNTSEYLKDIEEVNNYPKSIISYCKKYCDKKISFETLEIIENEFGSFYKIEDNEWIYRVSDIEKVKKILGNDFKYSIKDNHLLILRSGNNNACVIGCRPIN